MAVTSTSLGLTFDLTRAESVQRSQRWVLVSMQEPLQRVCPAGHWQAPLTQLCPDGHGLSQLPQCASSLCGSTQSLPQSSRPVGQLHAPLVQLCAAGQDAHEGLPE